MNVVNVVNVFALARTHTQREDPDSRTGYGENVHNVHNVHDGYAGRATREKRGEDVNATGRLVHELESRVVAFSVTGDGVLHVGPARLLDAADRQALADPRPDLAAVVAKRQRRAI